MTKSVDDIIKNIVIISLIAMFFSCVNNPKEVRDFLADKNLPIGEAVNIIHQHTDSGRINVKMTSPLMLDFSNRENHPYSEFPKGIKIINIEKNGDSTTIEGNYAINYSKTNVSEIKDNVIIHNYAQNHILKTEQLFWDKNTHYYFTEKKFEFYTSTDTIYGNGFEATEDLKIWWVKNQTGVINYKELNE